MLVQTNYAWGNHLWITVPETGGETGIIHVRNQLIKLLNTYLKSNKSPEFDLREVELGISIQDLACRALGPKALVVVDNLPAMHPKDPLLHFLVSLVGMLSRHGSILVSTSQTRLPVSVAEELGDKYEEIAVPPFDRFDVFSLLDRLKAPEHIKDDKIINLILSTTYGHPALVSATISWLRRRNWALDIEVLSNLLEGDPAKSVREETVRFLPHFIADDSTRQFLYRLSILFHSFDEKLAQLIAEVPPPISLPGEKLIELHGPWLSRTPKGTLEISPLLRGSGELNLNGDLKKTIHAEAANELLSRSPIPADQVFNIALNLFSSDQGDRLAAFLSQALMNVKTKSQAEYFDWASSFLSKDAPKQLDVAPSLLVMLRTSQIRLRLLAGRDVADLWEELDLMLENLSLEEPANVAAALGAYVGTGPLLDGIAPLIGVVRGIKFASVMRSHPELNIDLLFPFPPEEIVWFSLVRFEKIEEYERILPILKALPAEQLDSLLNNSLGNEAVYIWVDRILEITARQPVETIDWQFVLAILEQIRQIGSRETGLPLFIAATRACAIVYADYLKQSARALEILKNVPRPLDPIPDFILAYTTASILFGTSTFSNALIAYNRALSIDIDLFDYYRFDSLRRVTEIYGSMGDWSNSSIWCLKALDFGRKHKITPLEDQIEMLGELAWIRWNEEKRKKAAAAMYAAITALSIDQGDRNLRYKEAFFKTGHVLGWMASVANHNVAPETTLDGETYLVPFAGMISRQREAVSQAQANRFQGIRFYASRIARRRRRGQTVGISHFCAGSTGYFERRP